MLAAGKDASVADRRSCRRHMGPGAKAAVHTSFAAIARAQPTTPLVTRGLVPRAHSAAAPRLSTEARSPLLAWIAGRSPLLSGLNSGPLEGHLIVAGGRFRIGAGQAVDAQIGRASCGERVCLYV